VQFFHLSTSVYFLAQYYHTKVDNAIRVQYVINAAQEIVEFAYGNFHVRYSGVAIAAGVCGKLVSID